MRHANIVELRVGDWLTLAEAAWATAREMMRYH